MSLDDQVVRVMEPGRRYEVTRIAAEMRSDYATVFFALSRLENWGFVQPLGGNEFQLTEAGTQLHNILLDA